MYVILWFAWWKEATCLATIGSFAVYNILKFYSWIPENAINPVAIFNYDTSTKGRLQGYFRTGKRISMRRAGLSDTCLSAAWNSWTSLFFPLSSSSLDQWIATEKLFQSLQVIPFIASNYRRDKIWLRRTKPSKREYQAGRQVLERLETRMERVFFVWGHSSKFILRQAGAHISPRYNSILDEFCRSHLLQIVVAIDNSRSMFWPRCLHCHCHYCCGACGRRRCYVEQPQCKYPSRLVIETV